MALSLSEFQTLYPKVVVRQPKNLFYRRYGIRVTIRVPRESSFLTLMALQQKITKQFPEDSIHHRRERRTLNIFVENDTAFDQLIQYLKTQTCNLTGQARHVAADQLIHEVQYNSSNIVRGQIRSSKIKSMGFNYQLYINTQNEFSVNEKHRLLKKIEQDRDQFRVPESVIFWLSNPHPTRCWYRRYFYVRDPQIVTFLQLGCGDIIGEVLEVLG